jgi:hypothetical protein
MDITILTIWITVTIFTIIPNIILAYKLYTKDFKNLFDSGLYHSMCFWVFVYVTVLQVGGIVNVLLEAAFMT